MPIGVALADLSVAAVNQELNLITSSNVAACMLSLRLRGIHGAGAIIALAHDRPAMSTSWGYVNWLLCHDPPFRDLAT